jgi:hypothetical protein
MPLKDIRAGMHGVGKTVFSGDKVEDFQVEILGVLENTGPKENIILGRLSGGPLEHTGVMQGMSGSPVYIDGKLIGAVALAFPYAKDPIAGIRPIEEMLKVDSEKAPVQTPVAAGSRGRGIRRYPDDRSGHSALAERVHRERGGAIRTANAQARA